MSATENKQLMHDVFGALSRGDGEPFVESLANDVRWTITGTSPWSRTYDGKKAVQAELLGPLFAQFADRYTSTDHRFIAEGDRVVVEFRGSVTTKRGRPYENTYCYVCRLAGGKLAEIVEYWDTQLANDVLAPPPNP